MTKILFKLHQHSVAIIVALAMIALVTIVRFQTLPSWQFLILSTLVAFYLFWALLFHFLDKSLKLEIAIEYILTALLALIFFYGVLL